MKGWWSVADAVWMEFRLWREGMTHALEGGLWLHRFTLRGERMAHLVSADRRLLMDVGARLGLAPDWLQHKPLRYPPTGERVEAWHWDLRGVYLARALAVAGPRR